MFECNNCGAVFDKPIRVVETHGFRYPPYEELDGCPRCKVADIHAVEEEGEDDYY